MEFSVNVLDCTEKAIMGLRALYEQHGYERYKMGRFEEYGMYAANRSFLKSREIITFTGKNGRLMALRPDVTLSIVKGTRDGDGLQKLYYNENIYRPDEYEFKEQMQTGVECIGEIDAYATGETLMLAWRSLGLLGNVLGDDGMYGGYAPGTQPQDGAASGEREHLDISHMGYIDGLLHSSEMADEHRAELLRCINEKNVPGLVSLCSQYGLGDAFRDRVTALISINGPYDEVLPELRRISANEEMDAALDELDSVVSVLGRLGVKDCVNFDFSIINDLSYYSGIIFQGYIRGVPSKVLSGGRYDRLMRRFGKRSGAIGFAVYLNLLERTNPLSDGISIALPKGRLGEQAYAIFQAAGYECPDINEGGRRLIFENPEKNIRYFWIKPSDVAIYVERGIADIGVVGKDILVENTPDVYELLDLNMGKCRMCVAAVRDYMDWLDRPLRVATKFPNITKSYYETQGRDIDIIKLRGSIELAPQLGLSDVIVDIVESGSTLRENKLEPIEQILEISARLIANKVSYKFGYDAISEMCDKIAGHLG